MYKTNNCLYGLFNLCDAMKEKARYRYEDFSAVMFYESINDDGWLSIESILLNDYETSVELLYNINNGIIEARTDYSTFAGNLSISELVDIIIDDELEELAEELLQIEKEN